MGRLMIISVAETSLSDYLRDVCGEDDLEKGQVFDDARVNKRVILWLVPDE